MSYSGKFKDKDNNLHPVTSVLYGTCDTAAATAAKVVTCSDFDRLMTGVTIRVKFANANTAENPTVNINSTGAKSVYRFGSTAPVDGNSWNAGEVVELVYDGTSFFMTGADDLSVKQNVTDNSLETEAKTIVGAINEHEGDIGQLKSGLTNLTNDVKLNTQDLTTPSRTKNLLEIQSESQTLAGITYTVNDDGTITADGTATGTSIFAFYISKQSNLGKSYIFSGCHNGSYSTYKLQAFSDSQGSIADDIGSGATFNAITAFVVRIVVYSGTTLSNVVFDPMLRLSTETDPTFAPYIPSVESRIEAVEERKTKWFAIEVPANATEYDYSSDAPADAEIISVLPTDGAGLTVVQCHLGQKKIYFASAPTSKAYARVYYY